MLETSELYKMLLRDPKTVKEIKVEVSGVVYGQDRIVSCETTRSMFAGSTLGVGGCYAAQIDLAIIPDGQAIPKMARMDVYTRLVLGNQASEWIPDGQYFIDTRVPDSGVLTIHGYDAMLKAEQTYLNEGVVGQWPRPVTQVVEDICQRMSVTLDQRTTLNPGYMVEYPNDYTMREILGYVAAAHGGNWVMTKEGKLRLIRLSEIPAETNYLVDKYGDAILFGEVRIIV